MFFKEERTCGFSICIWGNKKNMQHYNTQYGKLSNIDPDDVYERMTPVFQPTGLIHSGIAELDDLLGGLHTGKITVFVGKSKLLSNVLHRVCVNTFDLFHSASLVLDAGNQLNPFFLARLAQLHMLSSKELLQQVHLSRIYTVYQLTDLLHTHVEQLMQQLKPVTVVLTGFFSLLDDADISDDKKTQLLQTVMNKVRSLATRYQVAMILIDRQSRGYESTVIDGLVDTTVMIQDMRHCPRLTITQKNQQVTVTSETVGQLCLPDFGMVI